MLQILNELNPQQLEAATSNERTILCLAGAGAGKTKTMIARIARLVDDGADPKSILALTFTNKAAAEMKNRFCKIPEMSTLRDAPEFRTFHSFCYSLIVKDRDVRERLGYSKIPQLCDDAKLKEIKTTVKLAIGCKLTDAQLDNDVSLSRKDAEDKKLFQKALIKQIKKENVITFDIMCYNVCELFEKHDEVTQKYRQQYKYIHVDEFQDTDRKQFRFASSFPDTTNFWFCADALQNIYSFRGTTNEYVKQLSTAPGWKVIKLYKNYRSTNQICNFANKFSTYAKDEYRITMEGQRDGEDPEVIYGSFSSYNEPVDRVHLETLIEKLKQHKQESAILCRTNKECGAVRAALKEAGIDYSASNKSSDAVDILESALSNEYMIGFLSSRLEGSDYGDYIRLSAIEEKPDINWFLRVYGNKEKINKIAHKIIEIRNIVNTCTDIKEQFDKIAALLRVKSRCKYVDTIKTSKEVVESIRDQIQQQEECQIYCGTIHSSKGLEYDTVYVMGVDDTMFKLGTEEMNNLFYVAITRPKNHLTVFRR